MKRHFLKHLSLLVTTVLLTTCVCASTMTANTPVAVAADNETTTTTAVACYATQLSYDRSPMAVGETRAIQFYHPVTKVARGGSVDTTSTNIAISYEDGSDTVYVTALAEGEAKLYIRESDCAFGAYAYLTIEEDTTTTTTVVPDYATQLSYDRSPMQVGETRAIRFYHPETNIARGGSVDTTSTNIAISYEDGSDTVYVTALAEGEAKLYIRESDCAFGAYAYLTIEEEQPILCFPRGDANQDGKLTTGDARLVLSYCLSGAMPLSDDWLSTADFDGNGKIETGDARSILATTVDLM